MAKFTDGGWVPENDPMFNGSWMMFSVRKPKQSTETGKQEKPGKPEVKNPTVRPPKAGGIKPRTRKMCRMAPEIVAALQKAKRRTKLSETAYVEQALKEKFARDGII